MGYAEIGLCFPDTGFGMKRPPSLCPPYTAFGSLPPWDLQVDLGYHGVGTMESPTSDRGICFFPSVIESYTAAPLISESSASCKLQSVLSCPNLPIYPIINLGVIVHGIRAINVGWLYPCCGPQSSPRKVISTWRWVSVRRWLPCRHSSCCRRRHGGMRPIIQRSGAAATVPIYTSLRTELWCY